MENASKAIVMAGGVLIAIAVIGVAVYFYTSAGNYARQADQLLSASQIQSFNRFYTAYNSQNGKIRMIDALNLLNRAVEDEVVNSYAGNYIKKVGDHYEVKAENYYLVNAYFKLGYDPQGKVSSITIRDNSF